MDLQSYIEKYEAKTHTKFEPKPGFELIFSPEHGFCEICVGETALFVWQMCGDARWWFDSVTDIVRRMRLRYIVANIIRPVQPFIRIFGYRIRRTDTAENGTQRFYCQDKQGRRMTAVTRLDDEGRYAGAILSWEVGGPFD